MQPSPNPNFLIEMVYAKMPFGKYEGRFLTDLPVNYLEWFSREGFPAGHLGQYLSTLFEIRTNGLDDLLKPIVRMRDAHKCIR
jgi:uncharacterized protein (DUF3820 family)